MKNFFALVSGAVLLLSLTACKEVAIQDGRIPAGYEQKAAALVGTYTGSVATSVSQVAGAKESAVLKVNIVNRRPVLTTSVDFMGAGCGSSIGPLESVSVDNNGNLTRAVFGFDGGSCVAESRIILNFFQRGGAMRITAFVTQSADYPNGDSQRLQPTITERIGRFTSVR